MDYLTIDRIKQLKLGKVYTGKVTQVNNPGKKFYNGLEFDFLLLELAEDYLQVLGNPEKYDKNSDDVNYLLQAIKDKIPVENIRENLSTPLMYTDIIKFNITKNNIIVFDEEEEIEINILSMVGSFKKYLIETPNEKVLEDWQKVLDLGLKGPHVKELKEMPSSTELPIKLSKIGILEEGFGFLTHYIAPSNVSHIITNENGEKDESNTILLNELGQINQRKLEIIETLLKRNL